MAKWRTECAATVTWYCMLEISYTYMKVCCMQLTPQSTGINFARTEAYVNQMNKA